MHLLCNEVVFGEIPSEGLEAARVVEGGTADEAGHAGHAVDAEQARDQVDARQPRAEVNLGRGIVFCKRNLRNPILEGLFILRLMLRFPPILAGKRNWMCGFHRPSKMRFLRFR